MLDSIEDTQFERVARRVEPQGTLLRAWPLQGGVSAQVTALEVSLPDGRTRKLVVRRHGAADLKRNQDVAADEFRLLRIVQRAGIAAPAPYHLDQSGEIFATPYLVIEYVEGEPDFSPSDLDDVIRQMAAQLAAIHRVDASTLDLAFLPRQEEKCAEKIGKRPSRLDESFSEGHIRDTLEAAWPLPQSNASVLLHGDYWPGNLLYKDGRLVAVIDWEDAALGDPLADVANCRLELLWASGLDAMRRFTDHYRSMTAVDVSTLPYWDLWAALRPIAGIANWGLDAAAYKAMREGHRAFVAQAFETLAARYKEGI